MDRAEISLIAHHDHRVAAPVSDARLDQLVGFLTPPDAGRAVDLGCGSGAWLLRALEAHPGLTGVGVDVSRPALGAAAREAEKRSLSTRVRWVEGEAETWRDGLFDVVICVGASHIFGGLEGTLRALRTHLRAGGQVVLGDAVWERPPTQAALEALRVVPEEFPDLAGLVDRACAHGFEICHGHVSTLAEWDDYEWSWTGSLIRWALDRQPGDAERAQALSAAREHRAAWLLGYRQQLGFVTLVLLDDGQIP